MPTKKPVGKALNERQAKFAYHYVHDEPIGKHAAIKAGYTARSAEYQASMLLRNPKVKAEIARHRREREARTAVTTDTVITRLNREADERGEGGTHSGRIRALELLGKHLGMFRDDTPPVVVQQINDRPAMSEEEAMDKLNRLMVVLAARKAAAEQAQLPEPQSSG